MSILLHFHRNFIKHRCPLRVDKQGQIKKATFLQLICRINPYYAKKQDMSVARSFQKLFRRFDHANDTEKNILVRSAKLFKNRVLKKGCLKDRKIKEMANKIALELNIHLLSKSLSFSSKLLRKHSEFVNFAIKNHFHHRVDQHYRNNGLGIRYNFNTAEFELPVRTNRGIVWKHWTFLPVNKKGRIDGYDLMAYGWERHDNCNWKRLKPFKLLTKSDFKAKFPKLSVNTAYIELVTTIPTFKKPPGQFGHVYVNFYVPKHGKISFYSVGYDLTNISVPDVLEFIERKRVSSIHKITRKKWLKMKRFIEAVQKIHVKRRKNRAYRHSNKKAMDFTKKHLGKNCGNFAVALFEMATGVQNLYTLFPIMRVLFPKPFHYVVDWIEDKLPRFLQILIQKVNIVTRGVIPWHLIPRQLALAQSSR